jgi:polysaccharide export outer membrane protein
MATRFARGVLVLAVAILATGVMVRGDQGNPKVAARDQLVITVVGVQEFSRKYPVGIDGAIEFPQLGRVGVAGMTVREVGQLLAEKLKTADILLRPQVTVELEQTATKQVTVNGAVVKQGPLAYAGELTLLDALVRAGGRLPEAADTVLIVRASPLESGPGGAETTPNPAMFEVNARELENGKLEKNLSLQDGDAIFVRKALAVTITGFVRSVGAYNIEPGSNVEQALALAGGISERGSSRRIEITRKVDGKTKTIKGVKMTDPVLPGDIIKVGPRIL